MKPYLLKQEIEALKPLIDRVRSQLFTLETRKEALENELRANTNRSRVYEEKVRDDSADIGRIEKKEEKFDSPDFSKLSSYK